MSSRPGRTEIRRAAGSCEVDGEQRLFSLTILAQPDRLRLVRAAVSEAAKASGCSEECTRDIVLAVDEACQNVIRHAYGGQPGNEICIDVRRSDEKIVFDVMDFAEPVDPDRIKPRNLEEIRPGGLGTHFINECMDEAKYSTPPPGVGNLLRMTKRIA
jgi:sigma-B regulation protein RsbU (phosphoserine phosphatase)